MPASCGVAYRGLTAILGFVPSLTTIKTARRDFYDAELFDLRESKQCYRDNSAVLETTLRDSHGAAVQITDFAPRFKQFGRVFRPGMLVRQIVPLAGAPRIRIRLRPAYGYGRDRPETTHGSNHIRYVMPDLTLRLTTDGPVTYILEEVPFILETPMTLILGPDESFTLPVAEGRTRVLRENRRLLAGMVSLPLSALRMAGAGDPGGYHSQTVEFRGIRSDHRGADHVHSQRRPTAAGIGTTATAGCAIPISWCTR